MPGVETDELYRVPLDEFVNARTELVRRLRAAGERDAAAEVSRRRRPSIGAWAVNRLAAEAPELVAGLLAAAADATRAQRSLAGDGGAALREASARVRELLDDAGGRIATILDASGHAASETNVRRAQTTLQAAAAGGRAEREALLRGVLDRDLDPPGFGGLEEPEEDTPEVAAAIAGRLRPVAATVVRPRVTDAPVDARRVELEHALRGAERDVRERRGAAERAAATAARLRERADRLDAEARAAATDAADAEREAAAATAGAEAAEARLQQARDALITDGG